MLVEKEIIAPGIYFYTDEKTGLPRKLVVTAEMTKYWRDEGSKMLSAGLTVPVPCEHDFDAHPMTPADKLKNNAGWLKEYRVRDVTDPRTKKERKDVLFGVVDIQDDEIAKKLPRTIRWTSPWINSFTDGSGKQWNNVISHLALTTRPRIVEQTPFSSIAAALSLATETKLPEASSTSAEAKDGLCLSRAGRLVERKSDKKLLPQFPIAFSLLSGGIKLAGDGDMSEMDDDGEERPKKKKKFPPEGGKGGEGSSSEGGAKDGKGGGGDDGEDNEEMDIGGLMNPMKDAMGDVKMEELLCDLLNALGVMMPDHVGEGEFKRALYEAAMSKIKELTSKAQAGGDANAAAAGANTSSPAGGANQPNPLIQQEQQPMFMSLEEIQKIADPTMKTIALSMYNENTKLRAEADADRKKLNSLNDAKLKEENTKRQTRVALLGKVSPKVKADLDAMLALPAMALSMGEGGAVVDPMAQTLAVLEKGLADLPRLMTTPSSEVIALAQPTDADMLTEEKQNEIANGLARMMGCPPEQKKQGAA
jgi:hypothetical protein